MSVELKSFCTDGIESLTLMDKLEIPSSLGYKAF